MRGKGEGSIFQRKQDGMYVARIELPPRDGKRRQKVIVRKYKRDALKALDAARKELERSGDLITETTTVETWLELWLANIMRPKLKPSTFDTYDIVCRARIIPAIGKVRLDKLTPQHVRQLHEADKAAGRTGATAHKTHMVLRKALVDAEREGRVTRNVATLVDPPRKQVSTRKALTAAEARTLLDTVDGTPQALPVTMSLLTGIRRGELLGITRDAIDLENGLLRVEWQLQRITWGHGCGGKCRKGLRAGACPDRVVEIPADQEARQVVDGLWLVRPKSRAGWREVPLHPGLVAMLTDHLASHPLGPEGLIFTRGNEGKRPVDPKDATRDWAKACAAAKVAPVPLHSARHTTATLLFELGVPEDTRVAILGHSSATVTQGYTHVSNAVTADAMQRLGQHLALG